MKFGPVPVRESVGGVAVHGLQAPGAVLRKGETVTAAMAQAFAAAGIDEVVVARLETGDVAENDAARTLAEAVAGANLRLDRAFTGRVNLFATAAGVLRVDAGTVDAVNAVDEAITLATLAPYRAVAAGEMVATVKIIPFAVDRAALGRAVEQALARPVAVAGYRPLRVGVISTLLPGLKDSVVAKTLRVLGTRLAPAGATLAADLRISHAVPVLATAFREQIGGCDLLIVFGASAITDRRDVIPAGLVAAGGTIEHFGMPVDPGNLICLGRIGDRPALVLPGCARSPKENGFDWVLQRLLAGVPVGPAELRRLGAGGLLMEIVSRPQPRAGSGAAAEDEA